MDLLLSLSLLIALFELDPLTPMAYAFAYAWAVPALATSWLILASDHLGDRPLIRRALLGWVGVLDIVFFAAVYIFKQYEVNDVEDSIYKDSLFVDVAYVAVLLLSITLLFGVGSVYFWAGQQTTRPLTRFKCRLIGTGAVLFVFAAGTDGMVSLDKLYLFVIVRVFLMASLACLYFGYTTPEWVKQRILARSPTSEPAPPSE